MNAEAKFEAALLMDHKFWKQQRSGGARPLRKWPLWLLQKDHRIYEKVRNENNFSTLGEARDLIGKELRLRVQQGDG
jgi:hypothetical protein